MLDFGRVLIALELGDEDESTLAYASRLFRLLQPKRVDVVHVLDTRMVPDAILEKYSDWLRPARQRRSGRLRDSIAGNLEVHEDTAVHQHILAGAPLRQILDLSSQQRSSVIITGSSNRGSRVATLPVRLARRAGCSVLIVPAGSPPRLQELLVPIDFDQGSAYAVTIAAALADRALTPRLRGLHAYALPPGARESGKSEKALAEIVLTYARHAYDRFLEGITDLSVPLEMEYVLDLHPAHAVLKAARRDHCDLIVMGEPDGKATGQGQLGRVAVRVIYDSPVPVLFARRSGQDGRTLDRGSVQTGTTPP